MADSYDAMTEKRPCYPARSHQEVMDALVSERGNKHDPTLVDPMLSLSEEWFTRLDPPRQCGLAGPARLLWRVPGIARCTPRGGMQHGPSGTLVQPEPFVVAAGKCLKPTSRHTAMPRCLGGVRLLCELLFPGGIAALAAPRMGCGVRAWIASACT